MSASCRGSPLFGRYLNLLTVGAVARLVGESEENLMENREDPAGRAEHRGYFDDLTGLPARPWYDHMLTSELARAKRYHHVLSQIVIEIDGFAALTKDHGSASGDYVLMTIADILRSTIRASDQISRISADEFAVVLPETDIAGAQVVGEKVRRSVELYPFDEGFEITVSVGITSAIETDTPDSFSARGETAAKEAGGKGGNSCAVANA